MPIEIQFGPQDSSMLRGKEIDASGLSTAQRALIDARVNDACFFSSKVSDAKLLEKMRTYIAEAAEGKRFRGRADFIATMREAMGVKGGKDSGKLTDITSSRRLGLIFDFQQERLSAQIFLAQGEDKDHRWAYPCLELVRVLQRENPRNWKERWREAGGTIRDGRMVALRDDPIWRRISRFGSPVPPFDFNSGMGLEEVNRFEAEALGIDVPDDEDEEALEDESLELKEDNPPEEADTLEARAKKIIEAVPAEQKEFYTTALKSTNPLCKEAAIKAAEKEAIPFVVSPEKGDSYFSPEDKRISISFDAPDITKKHEFFHYVDYVAGGGSFATGSAEFESARNRASRAIAKAKKTRADELKKLKEIILRKPPKFFREEADAKLRALGIDPKKVYDFFEDVKDPEGFSVYNYFATAGIGARDSENVRVWWFARCLERQDPEGAVLCFAEEYSVAFKKRIEAGAIRELSDYIGTITKNKSLGCDGCLEYGHDNSYYSAMGRLANSELMAQFGAMSGDYKDAEIARLIAKTSAPELWENLTNILKDFTKGSLTWQKT